MQASALIGFGIMKGEQGLEAVEADLVRLKLLSRRQPHAVTTAAGGGGIGDKSRGFRTSAGNGHGAFRCTRQQGPFPRRTVGASASQVSRGHWCIAAEEKHRAQGLCKQGGRA